MGYRQIKIAALIAIVLLMQSVAIVHSVEHQQDEHTQWCDAFLIVDETSDFQVESTDVANHYLSPLRIDKFSNSYAGLLLKIYPSRAPPKL